MTSAKLRMPTYIVNGQFIYLFFFAAGTINCLLWLHISGEIKFL